MFSALNESITGRAIFNGIIDLQVTDIRAYSSDKKHFKCDDAPFGGGAGMIMTPQPIYSAVSAVDPAHTARRIFLSPSGKRFDAKRAKELSGEPELLFLCGRYEGVDRRVIDLCIDEEISIGDFILTGGELAAMVIIDSVSRFLPGVLGNGSSSADESFQNGLLEYPQYTRPYDFMGLKVPDVLISGHHENIEKWKKQEAEKLTKKLRPDLLDPL
jgi:tRNA (guanine37-N1)-methyltransferase